MENRKEKEAARGPARKTGRILPVLAAALVLCAAALFPIGDSGASGDAAGGDGDLVIPVARVGTDASFFPVRVNGTMMEVIAVRDGAGSIRTAFNACQICYDSGRGHYTQSGAFLVCGNCGNRFSMEQVGVSAGGCNPWPILKENRTDGDDAVVISRDFLEKSQKIFADWKIER